MADGFTRRLFQWLDQVGNDRSLKPTAFLVAYIIGRHINRQEGMAWPSQASLAHSSGLTVRSVQTCLHDLAALGHLQIASGRGRRIVSQYRTVLRRDEKTNDASSYPAQNTKPASSITPTETTNLTSPFECRRDAEKAKSSVRKGEKNCNKTRSLLPTEPFEEPSEEPFELHTRERRTNSRRQKLSSIPDNWPDERDLNWAVEHWSKKERADLIENAGEIAARCRDHHLKVGSHFVDWRAAWRTWAMNEIKFNKPETRRSENGGLSAARGVIRAMVGGDT